MIATLGKQSVEWTKRIVCLHKRLISNAYAVYLAVGNSFCARRAIADELKRMQEQIDRMKEQMDYTYCINKNHTNMHIDNLNNYGVIIDVHHNTVTIYPPERERYDDDARTTPPADEADGTKPDTRAADEPHACQPRIARCAPPQGRRKTSVFASAADAARMARLVRHIHAAYYNPANRRVEIDGDSYGETDFLLCVYYAMVKHGWASDQLAAQPYYEFLTKSCGIRPQDSEKTFLRHLNKVLRTGKSFHLLTPELLSDRPRPGTLTAAELPAWQRMFAAAERTLLSGDTNSFTI